MAVALLSGCVTATSTGTPTDAQDGVTAGTAGADSYMDAQERELRQRLNGAAVAVARDRDDIVLRMAGHATFEQDRADVSPEFLDLLGTVAGVLGQYQSTVIEVSGFTDASGPMIVNMALSLQRAESVAQQLVSMGVAAERIVAKGLGPLQPVADNETPEGRQQNRRVELTIRPIRPPTSNTAAAAH